MKNRILAFALIVSFTIGSTALFAGHKRAHHKCSPPAHKRISVAQSMKPHPHAIRVSGHWQWGGNKYVRVNGEWQNPRRGYIWIPGHWKKIRHGHHWVEGHWKKIRK